MSTKPYTLDQVRRQIANYAPAPTTATTDQWELLRPTVTSMVTEVFTYASAHPGTPSLSRGNVQNYLTCLTSHLARVTEMTSDLEDVELFTPETVAWSVNQEAIQPSTKTERKRHLRRMGEILIAVGYTPWQEAPRSHDEQSAPYTPQELVEILNGLDAQGTAHKNECARVIVTLALAGLVAPKIDLVKAQDVTDSDIVTVTVDGREHVIAPSLADEFLKIVRQRKPDEFVFCPTRKRKVQYVTEFMHRFQRGPNTPDVSVRRLVATWRLNLIERGISEEAFIALTGLRFHAYKRHSAFTELDERGALEMAMLATEWMITGNVAKRKTSAPVALEREATHSRACVYGECLGDANRTYPPLKLIEGAKKC